MRRSTTNRKDQKTTRPPPVLLYLLYHMRETPNSGNAARKRPLALGHCGGVGEIVSLTAPTSRLRSAFNGMALSPMIGILSDTLVPFKLPLNRDTALNRRSLRRLPSAL